MITWPAYVHVIVDACPAASSPTAQMYLALGPSVSASAWPSTCSPTCAHLPSLNVLVEQGAPSPSMCEPMSS